MSEDAQGTYRLVGAKGAGEVVDRLVLEGSTSNPKRFVDVGGEIELSESEATDIRREHHVELRKVQGNAQSEETDNTVDTRAGQQDSQKPRVPATVPANVDEKKGVTK